MDFLMERATGMRDLLAIDMAKFRFVEEIFRQCCLEFGYEEIRTPTIEPLHLFTMAGVLTPTMLNKVYSFLDWDGWSGERVVLRPEGTIPVSRLYLNSSELMGIKLAKYFYVENMFRYEDDEEKSREFWQGGVELLGSPHPQADVELIHLATAMLKKLGFDDIHLHLSHAGILKNIIQELNLSEEKKVKLSQHIRKSGFKELAGENGVEKELKNILHFFDIKGKGSAFLHNLKPLIMKFPTLESEIDSFIRVTQLLDLLDYRYEVNFRFAENFEYYTGVMFEIFYKGQRICGGGRYDELIQLFNTNRSAPAMGFAFDFNSLIQLIGPSADKKQPKILVALSPNVAEQKFSFQLVDFLRAEGLKAEIDLGYQHKEVFNWIIFPKESFIELKNSNEEISRQLSWAEKSRLKTILESAL